MENASKALIIAGAILIAILLISAGVYLMGMLTKPQEQAGAKADTMAIDSFNSDYTSYIGSSKSASEVKALLSRIISSNAVAGNAQHQITVSSTAVTSPANGLTTIAASATAATNLTNITTIQGKLLTSVTYTVTPTYTAGYITSINIK